MIEVYLIFDVEFGYETGFTKEFKAKSTYDVLTKANEYMKSDDYNQRASRFDGDPKFERDMIYQIKHFDGVRDRV